MALMCVAQRSRA